jgi:hypothetical protein
MTFTATALPRRRGGITIELPFDPADAWGERDRYYVAGTIARYPMRAVVVPGDPPHMDLGPAWCRDPRVGAGAVLEVSLSPEGPQVDTVSEELAEALRADPAARRAFESLATHYRKGFVRWVDGAKRSDTREKRVAATIAALRAGRREP